MILVDGPGADFFLITWSFIIHVVGLYPSLLADIKQSLAKINSIILKGLKKQEKKFVGLEYR